MRSLDSVLISTMIAQDRSESYVRFSHELLMSHSSPSPIALNVYVSSLTSSYSVCIEIVYFLSSNVIVLRIFRVAETSQFIFHVSQKKFAQLKDVAQMSTLRVQLKARIFISYCLWLVLFIFLFFIGTACSCTTTLLISFSETFATFATFAVTLIFRIETLTL